MEVRKTPTYIAADGTSRKELANVGGGTLYYKSTENVSSSSNDGSLTVGSNRVLTSGVWVVSASESNLAVRPLSPAEESAATSTVGNVGQRLLRILNEGIQDATLLFIGDSTSATYVTWAGKVVEGLAARYPAYTVKYRDWTDGNSDYNAASTKQTGTGSKTLTVYNCAVASKASNFQMAPYFDTMIASKQPDLIFLSHGHNHGGSSNTPEPFWRDALTIVTQAITRACPLAELVLIAQNPRTDVNAGVHALRQFVTEEVAQLSGFGFINAHRLFLDQDPTVASLIEADGIHPNAAGYTLQANEVLRRLAIGSQENSQQRSSFFIPSHTNALANGDFSSFASPPTLTSWTATNALLEKDSTNFESSNGYAVRMTTVSSASASFLAQNISGNSFKKFVGEWVTFLARVRIPSGQTGFPGRVNITENNGSHAGTTSSDTLSNGGVGFGQGAYRWSMCSRRIASDCTNASFILTCETNGFSGDVSIDRAIALPGIWPRDIR